MPPAATPAAQAAPPALPGCEGRSTVHHGNGRIPTSALCPVPDAPGHRLRPDAAHAFAQLSAARKAQTGRPLCVTDSYRSYQQQAAVHRAKPGLTARPGTSNHGTGIAVDLCGGVEVFGSEAHRWMRDNAGRFGWVLPSWARQDGNRPEPWHWEYHP